MHRLLSKKMHKSNRGKYTKSDHWTRNQQAWKGCVHSEKNLEKNGLNSSQKSRPWNCPHRLQGLGRLVLCHQLHIGWLGFHMSSYQISVLTQFVHCVLLFYNLLLQSCTLQHLQTIRKNCLRLTRWCRISGSPPWNKRHLIGLISDATHVIYFKWDDTSTLSDLCTHLLIPFAQTGKSKPAGRHMASLKKENS